MKKLVCVVEGRGDELALPNLCSRVRDYVEAWSWIVDPNPVRQPRSRLVDESRPSPHRTARADGIARAVELALQRPADGVVILCDADDDCPAVWGPSSRRLVEARCRGDSVMIEREYEAWLLYAFSEALLRQHDITSPESVRDAKGRLRRLVSGYKPTSHQLEITRSVEIATLWKASDSFDKLMRCLMEIFEVPLRSRPARPT